MLGNACGLVQREQCYLQGVKDWEEVSTPLVLLNETVTEWEKKKRDRFHVLEDRAGNCPLVSVQSVWISRGSVSALWMGYVPSPRNHACVMGKERALQTAFCVSICLLFIANAPKMEKKGCSDQNPPPLFPFFLSSFCHFCGLSAIYTLLSLQKQQINQQNQTSYLHLLVPTSLFLLQMCKTTLSWMMVVETET